MCCADHVTTTEHSDEFNALPLDWESDPVLLARRG